MSQKIRIIRALANPTKKRSSSRKIKKAKRRSARTRAPAYVVRLVIAHKGRYRADWWTGEGFSHQRNRAKRYPSNKARFVVRSRAFRSKLPANYVVADILPAKA